MTLYNTLSYFILYGFIGWCLESGYDSFKEGKACKNIGFLKGPFCPMYGFAVLLLLKYKELLGSIKGKRHRVKRIFYYISASVIMTAFEYFVGWLMEKLFKRKYWDYSHVKYNIRGKVCLAFTVIWGGLVYILEILIHPFFRKNIKKIPLLLKCGLVPALLFLIFLESLAPGEGME